MSTGVERLQKQQRKYNTEDKNEHRKLFKGQGFHDFAVIYNMHIY